MFVRFFKLVLYYNDDTFSREKALWIIKRRMNACWVWERWGDEVSWPHECLLLSWRHDAIRSPMIHSHPHVVFCTVVPWLLGDCRSWGGRVFTWIIPAYSGYFCSINFEDLNMSTVTFMRVNASVCYCIRVSAVLWSVYQKIVNIR